MKYAALAGALVALALPQLASASTDGARLGWFEPIARAAWPGSPCAGHEVVHLGLEANAAIARMGYSPDALAGLAEPDTCEVWLVAGLPADMFCSTLVHEFGHLAGREHSADVDNVMYPAGADYGPCSRAVDRAAAKGRARWTTARKRRHH